MSRTPIPVDTRKLLVERVAASRYVGRSARLRDLLLYVCDQVLEHGAHEIHEQQVGHAVFGRPVDYDTISDNIVRVHASMLRKRLEQYFSSEGRDEPITIELPKGNYAPVFAARKPAEAVAPLVPVLPRQEPASAPRTPWGIWLFVGLATLFALFSLGLFIHGKGLSVAPSLFASRPVAHGLWSQVFVAGARTDIVMDDEGVGLYQELTGRPIALSDYFNRNYLRALTANPAKEKLSQEAAASIILKRQSSYASAALLWKLGAIAGEAKGMANVHFARDYSFRELRVNNAVLLGNRLSNPWIEAFQDHLGLRWKYDGERGQYYPIDTWASKTKAENGYLSSGDGYATIAMLPNLGGTGTVLIVSSSGGSAMNAAGDFLADNESVAHLKTFLPHTQRDKFPYFEALLRVKSRSRLSRDTSIVICRPPRT